MKYYIPNRLFLLVFLLLIFQSQTNAQERVAKYVKGDILLQTTIEGDIYQIVNDLKVVDGLETNIELVREVSRPMRIWLVHFDHNVISQSRMLNETYMHSQVNIAQVNHILEQRATIPNDPQFNAQWQYVNTGQSGGVVDADIDADLAWDISTGGYTALGDTIVVCVIDEGIDINHNDLTPNRWINSAEIPNNGIDDDNNGYVDDYLGWNADNNNGNIAGSSHGTSVAGIIGARGDNGIGVAGINWNVKLMIVRGGGQEAAAIAAYTYPLIQRQKYNNTNGAEGAYVVATNASWGINNGQPANAPLWCAMYDTLGKYGILNAGAGPNSNVNVDVVGDLPTGCPSDYLITLTNMNHFDNKVTQAPIGPTTIDLGAPGAGTWTTTNGGYGSFGGTSGATPHVTGSIGLLYSVDCEGFAAISKVNPSLAAEIARDFILDNVDPNPDLINNTTTGGRLNLYKAMKNAVDSCVIPDCFPPYDLSVSNIIDTSALFTWNVLADTTRTFNLRWRVKGNTTWNIVTDTLTSYQFTALSACTIYELQVEMVCDTSFAYSDIYTFKTLGCCEFPTGLDAVILSDSSAALAWNSVLAANEYIVNYREIGSSIWIIDTVAINSYVVTDLDKCGEYEFAVQTVCDTGSTVASQEFIFVSGCGACTESFCFSSGGTQFEWVESVALDGVTYQTGNNGGYYRHDGVAFTLDKGLYTATITPGFSGIGFGEFSRVWIDYNQDGDFTDAGELVLNLPENNSAASGSFLVPIAAAEGITRLRVVMQFDEHGGSCENNYFGETEDYCVEITNVVRCDMPLALDTVSTTTSSIDIDWNSPNDVSSYVVRYKIRNTGIWTYANTTNANYSITGLLECNQYETQVATVCSMGDTSAYTNSLIMNTQCFNSTVLVPTSVSDVKVFPNPMTNHFNVSMRLAENQDITVQLLNVNGQLIQEQQFSDLNGEQVVQLMPNQSLSRGAYIVKVIADDGIIVRRIMK